MHPEVEKLLELQAIDARLELLRREVAMRPEALAEQGGEVGELQGRRGELRELRTAKKVDIDLFDLEIKSFEEKIAESLRRLNAATSGGEFQGLQQQIARFEREKGEVEEKLLQLWDEMDMIKKAEKEVLQVLGQAEEDLSEGEEEFAGDLAAIQAEARDLVTRRDRTVGTIEHEVLDQYDLLFSRYRERSVVSAEGGVCSGCHMAISPQIMNLLRIDAQIVRCDSCTRILHLPSS